VPKGRKDLAKKMKSLLIEQRERLQESINKELNELRGGERHHLADMDDLAADSAEESTAYHVMEIEQAELEQIDRALEAIEDGTYGTCEECSGKIGLERLKALPFATLCIDCKRELERSSQDG
jgi:DnaK suppressor protein